jgi:chemotaxis protein methyltransferase CheR
MSNSMTLERQVERLAFLVKQETGLDFAQTRRDDLFGALVEHGRAEGIEGLEELGVHLGKIGEAQLSQLAHHLAGELAIGETYFFRHPAHFDILKEHVVAKLAKRLGTDRPPMRAWCAACSTGEEAYSVATCLWEVFGPQSNSMVNVVASDISERALQRARTGIYGEWSFRGVADTAREKFFDRSGDSWTPKPPIRNLCRFSRQNLAQPIKLPSGGDKFDVIFCRNVLQYFEFDVARDVIHRIGEFLEVGGVLFVAPAEADARLFGEFEANRVGDSTFFVKSERANGARKQSADLREMPRRGFSEARPLQAPMPASAAPMTPPNGCSRSTVAGDEAHRAAQVLLSRARVCADAGDTAGAEQFCRWAEQASPSSGAPHLLWGIVLQGTGEWVQAEYHLTRAASLEPASPLPSFFLADLYQRVGRIGEARGAAAHARAVLQVLRPSTPLPLVDDTTAGQMLSHVNGVISSLGKLQ